MVTFVEQAVADLPVFFNSDEFGEVVTYMPAGDSGTSITICRNEDDPGMSDLASTDEMLILIKSAEINPKRGDTFIISGDTWYLKQVLSKDSGILKLKLCKSDIRRV